MWIQPSLPSKVRVHLLFLYEQRCIRDLRWTSASVAACLSLAVQPCAAPYTAVTLYTSQLRDSPQLRFFKAFSPREKVERHRNGWGGGPLEHRWWSSFCAAHAEIVRIVLIPRLIVGRPCFTLSWMRGGCCTCSRDGSTCSPSTRRLR